MYGHDIHAHNICKNTTSVCITPIHTPVISNCIIATALSQNALLNRTRAISIVCIFRIRIFAYHLIMARFFSLQPFINMKTFTYHDHAITNSDLISPSRNWFSHAEFTYSGGRCTTTILKKKYAKHVESFQL